MTPASILAARREPFATPLTPLPAGPVRNGALVMQPVPPDPQAVANVEKRPGTHAGQGRARRPSRRPCRLIHFMTFTAAVAMTIGLAPTLVAVLENPLGYWSPGDLMTYIVASALAFWTPILALIAMTGDRVKLRRSARSYGPASVIAATAAMTLVCARAFAATIAHEFHQLNWFGQFPGRQATLWPEHPLDETLGRMILWQSGSYYSPIAWRVVAEGAEGIVAAIVAVWVVLALSGKGRRPASWFDFSCFIVGLGWVLWLLWRDVAPPLPLF